MKNKILVLGATGNVGTPLVHMLKNHHADFQIGIKPDSQLTESMQGLSSVYVDFNDPPTLETAFTDIQSVFILIPDSPLMVNYATNIKNAILKNNVFRYIYLSGLGVKLAPGTWLSDNLERCEKIFRDIDVTGTVIRPTFFMQNFLNHYPPDPNNHFSLPIGKGKVNYIDVRDVACTALKLLIAKESIDQEEINLTGDSSYSMEEVVNLFSEVLGRSYQYSPISADESRKAMKAKELPDWLIEMLLQIYEKVREDRYKTKTQDFQMITGKAPKSLKSFIEEYQTYFNQIGLKINH